ncbi:MAG: sigma-70 family RNA polymerase sigma factor, partial [Christensenellaceae bacterium]|nr:sigma-70 family RNA polymerase sigma factor [Christensenellaceae bacterium]
EVSLSEPIGEDKEGNKLSLEDVVGAGEADIFSVVETKTDIEKLAKVFSKTLTPREAAVIRYRYGLMGEEMLPQREIAKKLGISRSYVSRIETKALKKLNLALRDAPEG